MSWCVVRVFKLFVRVVWEVLCADVWFVFVFVFVCFV